MVQVPSGVIGGRDRRVSEEKEKVEKEGKRKERKGRGKGEKNGD